MAAAAADAAMTRKERVLMVQQLVQSLPRGRGFNVRADGTVSVWPDQSVVRRSAAQVRPRDGHQTVRLAPGWRGRTGGPCFWC